MNARGEIAAFPDDTESPSGAQLHPNQMKH